MARTWLEGYGQIARDALGDLEKIEASIAEIRASLASLRLLDHEAAHDAACRVAQGTITVDHHEHEQNGLSVAIGIEEARDLLDSIAGQVTQALGKSEAKAMRRWNRDARALTRKARAAGGAR